MRICGSCTLCCRLLPVVELKKGANETCAHQCTEGCAIYDKRPKACRQWSCMWLAMPRDTAALARPDAVHYVIDPVPDKVLVGEELIPVLALQVWVDPQFPDAHRDPRLRDYLARVGEEHAAVAIIRYSSNDGFTLIPPSMNTEREFIEHRSNTIRTKEEMNTLEARGKL